MVLKRGEKMTVLNDVPYGSHERQKVDIYIPDSPVTRNGLILAIHGGGWRQGDKSILAPDTRYRCECGFICAYVLGRERGSASLNALRLHEGE